MSVSGLGKGAIDRRLEKIKAFKRCAWKTEVTDCVYFRGEREARIMSVFQVSAMDKKKERRLYVEQ